MTLLDTIKSLLGMDASDAGPERDGEPGVTVEREHEPDASTERTVKGADDGEPAPPQSASAGAAAEDEAVAAGEATETEASAETDEGGEAGGTDAAEATDEDDKGGAEEGESPDVLEGIGPAYAERLSDAGIETVAQLAEADPADLAERTDVSESRLERWVQRAKDR